MPRPVSDAHANFKRLLANQRKTVSGLSGAAGSDFL